MAGMSSGGRCQQCGTSRGSGHCAWRNSGLNLTDPDHPANNGSWDMLFKWLMTNFR